jgi:hypothetical protein
MLIDKYIEEMTKLRQAHGPELEVVNTTDLGMVKKAPLPRIGWRYLGRKCAFTPGRDNDKDRGEKVVRV